LGKGAFGEIYTAVNIYSGEKVAVKVEGPLNSTSKKRKPLLLMEMDVLKKLQGKLLKKKLYILLTDVII